MPHFSPNSGKRKRKILFEPEKKESKKLGSCQKITRVDEQDPSVCQCSQSAMPEPYKSEGQEMYLPKHGDWPSISKNTE